MGMDKIQMVWRHKGMKLRKYRIKYWRQFEMDLPVKYQFQHSQEEVGQFINAFNFPVIEKQMTEKSAITETALKQVQAAQKLYSDFIEPVHHYGCDIICEENSRILKTNSDPIGLYMDPSGLFGMDIGKRYMNEVMGRYLLTIEWDAVNPYGETETKSSKVLFTEELLLNLHDKIASAYRQLEQQYYGYAKGDAGEEYVSNELDLFKDKYKFAKNIKFRHEDLKGMTSETDLYVMTSKGLLVCEIKNKGNERYTFKISSDGQWSKYGDNGKFLSVEDSPFAQNTRHCIATEKLLKANGITDCRIIPVVIIGNEMVRIENDSENTVIRPSELYNYVERMNLPEKYGEQYQNKVIGILYDNNLEEENMFYVDVVPDGAFQSVTEYASRILEFITDIRRFNDDVRQCCPDKNKEAEMIKKKREKPLKTARVLVILFLILLAVLWVISNWDWLPGFIVVVLIIYAYSKWG